MTNLLHTLKFVPMSGLIQDQRLIAEIMSESQISKLERYFVFRVAVYALLWLLCPFPASDPVTDFTFR